MIFLISPSLKKPVVVKAKKIKYTELLIIQTLPDFFDMVSRLWTNDVSGKLLLNVLG